MAWRPPTSRSTRSAPSLRAPLSWLRRKMMVIEFGVDDQTAEDLAIGLDHIRLLEGVLDVGQSAVLGKKGRMAVHVQVLATPAGLDAAVQACFEETTTIGLRYHRAE